MLNTMHSTITTLEISNFSKGESKDVIVKLELEKLYGKFFDKKLMFFLPLRRANFRLVRWSNIDSP